MKKLRFITTGFLTWLIVLVSLIVIVRYTTLCRDPKLAAMLFGICALLLPFNIVLAWQVMENKKPK